ncbi:MAG: RNA-directed DNA polymerase [Desulfobulbaceae bacterium]|nr:RNA-directed DNA polymerase [Desulfobulbaceae bacterium]
MKRAGNLYESIAARENLRLAFCKAARGKHDRQEVIQFREALEDNLAKLQQQLVRQKPDIGHYHFFQVRDPKPRSICAASFPERVLHHAVMNICEPVLDRYAIHDSYACRKGKGSVRALERARWFTRKNNWYLKLDIRRYFDSIDQETVIRLLCRRFKDKPLLHLFEDLLATYHTEPGKGLPIGNLISQHLANFYLGHFDHWIKETLRVRCYLRYMDDFILFAENRLQLRQHLISLRAFLDTQLRLQPKDNVQLNRCRHGVPFLGFRVYPSRLKLGVRSKKRFRVKFRQYEQKFLAGQWTEKELIRHMEPLFGFSFIASSHGFRKHVIQRYGVLS